MNRYISIVDSAKLSGYNQDYITQLCRSGNLNCINISSVWFVSFSSLEKHLKHHKKELASHLNDLTFIELINLTDKQSFLIDGEEYCSTDCASELSGYNRDYITQLARSGVLQAIKIAKVWFVNKKSLIEFKNKQSSRKIEKQSTSLTNEDYFTAHNKKIKEIEYETLPVNEPIPKLVKQSANKIKIKKLNINKNKKRIDNSISIGRHDKTGSKLNLYKVKNNSADNKNNEELKPVFTAIKDNKFFTTRQFILATEKKYNKNNDDDLVKDVDFKFGKEDGFAGFADVPLHETYNNDLIYLNLTILTTYIFLVLSIIILIYINLMLFNILNIPVKIII